MTFFRLVVFALLAVSSADVRANGVSFPGRTSCVSPNLRWRITCTTDSRELHSLKIGTPSGPKEKPLFETGRWCEVLWQKNGDHVAITDWIGSNVSDVYVVDLRRPESKRTLSEIVPNMHKALRKDELEGHIYWEAVEWVTPTILLVRVFGHTDESNGHEFVYQFRADLSTHSYSLLSKENARDCRAEEKIWKSKDEPNQERSVERS